MIASFQEENLNKNHEVLNQEQLQLVKCIINYENAMNAPQDQPLQSFENQEEQVAPPKKPKEKPKVDEAKNLRANLNKLSDEELLAGLKESDCQWAAQEESLEMIPGVISVWRFNQLFRL